jgi:hypothetical protein
MTVQRDLVNVQRYLRDLKFDLTQLLRDSALKTTNLVADSTIRS